MEVAFSDRHGGVSSGPYTSLNLALRSGDDPERVRENLRRVEREFNDGRSVASMRQVHGAEVATLDSVPTTRPTADGLVTGRIGMALMVRVADCVPLLLADPEAGVVGAAHSGRLGLVAGVVPATIAAMRAHGARSITAWVGPHICGSCYEVPAAMRDEVAAAVPEAWAETTWGTPSVDIGAGVRAQLEAEDVDVVDARRCTREHEDLYSYRRDGEASGRFAGLIRIGP